MPKTFLKLKLNARGDVVRNLQATLAHLGYNIPTVESTERVFGAGTRQALIQLQAKNGLPTTGVIDDATTAILDNATEVIAKGPNQVDGQIFFDTGNVAPDLVLRLYNRGFAGADKKLAESRTDTDGFYSFTYNPGSDSANLEVRAVDGQGRELRLSNAKLILQKCETLNLIAPSSVKKLPSEFARMSTDLTKSVGSLDRLAAAEENSERQDLSILHQETGWDARLITLATVAVQLQKETGVASEALYALMRFGLPMEKNRLAHISPALVVETLKRAQTSAIIDLNESQVKQVIEQFNGFAREARLNMAIPGSNSSFKDLLQVSGLNEQEQTAFANLYFSHHGNGAELWAQAAKSGLPQASIDRLQTQGKLAYLTLNNAGLTKKLAQRIDRPDQLGGLVEENLYSSKAWKSLLTQDLVPSTVPGATEEERLGAYADELARKVRISFPTQVVSRMIANDELRLGGAHAHIKTRVTGFLDKATDLGFQLGQTPVGAFTTAHRAELFSTMNANESDQFETVEAVKRLQRLYQITPSNESMNVLLDLGFKSAQDIAMIPAGQFLDRYGDLFTTLEEATLVHRKARQVHKATFTFFVNSNQLGANPGVHAVSPTSERRSEIKASLIREFPTLESLFGSTDFCKCEHCRSVLSPAAYFVNLLQFLDPKEAEWIGFLKQFEKEHPGEKYTDKYSKPFEALRERRPDLEHLLLTCENTNTVLPYIDIVNEVLEYSVAKGKLDKDAVHNSESSDTSSLLAEPQNVLASAYATLKEQVFPIGLPFDLWTETVRGFSNHFGMQFWQILDAFRTTDELEPTASGHGKRAVFNEFLRLSADELKIFTDSSVHAQWFQLFGYGSETDALAEGELKSAKTLAHRLGLTYEQLTELIQLGFINPTLETMAVLYKLDLSVSSVRLYKENEGLLTKDRSQMTADEVMLLTDLEGFRQRLQSLNGNYSGSGLDAEAWLDQNWRNGAFDKVLVLEDSNAGSSFELTRVVYCGGAPIEPVDFLKMNLFVRLWRKLGWSMEDLDRALQVFVTAAQPSTSLNSIGSALKSALIHLAHLENLVQMVNFGKNRYTKALTLWSDIVTTGKNSLYAQLFLKKSILKDDPAFDHPLGQYLGVARDLKDHLPAVQAALGLKADEIEMILRDVGSSMKAAPLSLSTISTLYRYSLLAKALKSGIADIIALKDLSQLNPFERVRSGPVTSIQENYIFTRTIKFIEVAEEIKFSGFTTEDLTYLFKHEYNLLGKYRSSSGEILDFVRPLSAQLRKIQFDNAVPQDLNLLTEALLREKLSLILPSDAIEAFFGLMTGQTLFEAKKSNVETNFALDPMKLNVEPEIRASISENNGVRCTQHLTFKGLLQNSRKTVLLGNHPEPLFAELIQQIELNSRSLTESLFTKHFSDFLSRSQFDRLIVPAGPGQSAEAKRLTLAETFFPFLVEKLSTQTIVQTLVTYTDLEPSLTETLITNSEILEAPTQSSRPLIAEFVSARVQGLTASYFTSPDLTGTPTSVLVQNTDASNRPQNTNSMEFAGAFEIATAGEYYFSVKLTEQSSQVEIIVGNSTDPYFQAQAGSGDDEFNTAPIELKPGLVYPIRVRAKNLNGGNCALWIQGKDVPRNQLEELTLYPQASLDRIACSRVLIDKVGLSLKGLKLSEREVRYILTHPADFGGISFNKVPTQTSDVDSTQATKTFHQFLHLIRYAALRASLVGTTDDLIGVFEVARQSHPLETVEQDAANATFAKVCGAFASVSRQEEATVLNAAQFLNFTARATRGAHSVDVQVAGMIHTYGLARIWQILSIRQKLGVPFESLKSWAVAKPTADTANGLKNAVKALYPDQIWNRVGPSIFDPLRQKQRDALVTYCINKNGFTRAEQLFEHFLIDAQMEPVVQTSRIRLAISSLQTFIQRSLLNLEPKVHPSAIDSEQWQWMKRYRMWEANRKIFLYPENWLEPEFRDDKSSLFKDLESSLLQGDLSSDSAEDAFHDYLRGLEQISLLDIVAIYCEENLADPDANILHVIGRTNHLPHKYHYRKFAFGNWTPWLPMGLDIEGDHMVLTLWKGRLQLFWVTFLEKGSDERIDDQTPQSLAGMSTSSFKSKTVVECQLHWSEFYQGEWTDRNTAGFSDPLRATLDSRFEADTVKISAEIERNADKTDGAVLIYLNAPFNNCFRVVSRFSPPQYPSKTDDRSSVYDTAATGSKELGGNNLTVSFDNSLVGVDGLAPVNSPVPTPILDRGENRFWLTVGNPLRKIVDDPVVAQLISPFFYRDHFNCFYVEPALEQTTIVEWDKWAAWSTPAIDLGAGGILDKNTVVPAMAAKQTEAIKSIIDSGAIYRMSATMDWMANGSTTLGYQGQRITRSGKLNLITEETLKGVEI